MPDPLSSQQCEQLHDATGNERRGVSRHRQDEGTTMKPWMKCKEYIYFRYLVNQGIPKAARRQRHTSGDAGTTEISPC